MTLSKCHHTVTKYNTGADNKPTKVMFLCIANIIYQTDYQNSALKRKSQTAK